ncbi:MAG: HipA domain-containing protein [Gammaproteobacteria bacterium]
MSGFKHRLNAYLGIQCIGALGLTNENELEFFYHESWQQTGYPLSPHLPLDNSARNNQFSIRVFFQNVFPEGENLAILLETFHLSRSNIFSITQVLGQDLPGAMRLVLDPGILPTDLIFRPIQASEVTERLKHESARQLMIWDGKLRLSLAGVHQKINVVVRDNSEMGFGEGALCSTHILKFERSHAKHLVLNEFSMMKLAKAVGLSVADVSLMHFGEYPALLVKRFDREWEGDHIQRRHVIDGCQALNLLPDYKYERHLGSGRDVAHIRDGANLPALFRCCDTCSNPALAKKQLLTWVLFNVIIGNWDAHGKNLSFFVSPLGMEIAPAYDLISVRMYPEFSQEWAMALGDEFDAKSVGAFQLADFADSCELPRSAVARILMQLCERVARALPRLEYNAFTLELQQSIGSQIEYLKKQAKMISKVML